MISPEIIELLNNPDLGFIYGTRDEHLQPAVGRSLGAKLSDDGTTMRVFSPKSISEEHIRNLQQNGMMSLTVGHLPTHKSLQFKGKFIKYEECNEEDYQLLDRNVAAFKTLLGMAFGSQTIPLFEKIIYRPSVAIEFAVTDIFTQTPGPGAGKKVN